jgi:hypothetical protein
MQAGRAYAQAKSQREQESRLQMQALMEFQKEAAKVKREEAAALQKYNQGQRDAKSLAAFGSLIERQKSNPKFRAKAERGQLARKAIGKLAERGVSEDTIQRILGQVKDAETGIQDQEEREAAQEYLASSTADGVISEDEHAQYRAFIDSGGKGSAAIKDIHTRRAKNAAEEATVQANAEQEANAQALIQGMPNGYEKQLAAARLHEHMNDSAERKKEGSGARLYHDIQKIQLGSADDYEAEQLRLADEKKARLKRMLTGPAIGMGGMTGQEMKDEMGEEPTRVPFSGSLNNPQGLYTSGPEIPPLGADYQRYAQGLKAEKARRYPAVMPTDTPRAPTDIRRFAASLADSAGTPEEFAEALKLQGVDITDPAQLQEVIGVLGARRQNAAIAGAADL